jgi:hypothetical protein
MKVHRCTPFKELIYRSNGTIASIEAATVASHEPSRQQDLVHGCLLELSCDNFLKKDLITTKLQVSSPLGIWTTWVHEHDPLLVRNPLDQFHHLSPASLSSISARFSSSAFLS